MADSSTEICNLAISHIGIGKEIANIDSDSTNEASACRRFYTTARDKVLGDFNWPFATGFITLALVEENPTTEWKFSYRYPSDCVTLRRVFSGIRNDNLQSRIPYRLGRDTTGILIYCDIESAQMEYTVRETEVSRFAADFTMALSYLLAAYICPRITGSDRFKLVPSLIQLYQAEIANARTNALNEESSDISPESEFIRARDGILQSNWTDGYRSPF